MAMILGPLRAAAAQPARLGDRPLQPALPVLHAGAGLRLAAAGHVLTFEEIGTIVDAFSDLGVDRVRLTGGEPLLRRDLHVARRASLAARPAIRDLALTTNGVLLAPQAQRAARRGPAPHHRQPRHARPRALPALTRFDSLDAVLDGHRRGRRRRASTSLKIDTVVMRGVNDDELAALIEYGRPLGAEVRFIEYMDVGGATRWSPARRLAPRDARAARSALRPDRPDRRTVVGAGRSLPAARRHGLRHHLVDDRAVLRDLRSQPADRRRRLADVPLCAAPAPTCAARCAPARRAEELRQLIATVWASRADRGAEERLGFATREAADPRQRAQEGRAPGDAHAGGIRQS